MMRRNEGDDLVMTVVLEERADMHGALTLWQARF